MWPRQYRGSSFFPGCHRNPIEPQNSPSHIHCEYPGNRGTVEPSGKVTGAALASRSICSMRKRVESSAIRSSNSSRASGLTLSGDQPCSRALVYSARYSAAGQTNFMQGDSEMDTCSTSRERISTDYIARLGPQNKLNSLRYLGVLCVSAVFPGLSQTHNKLCDWRFLQQRLLSVWDSPGNTAETQRTPR